MAKNQEPITIENDDAEGAAIDRESSHALEAVRPQVKTIVPSASMDANTAMMAAISDMIEKGIDVDKMERLIDIHDRLNAKQAEQEFNQAMGRISMLLPRIKKDGTVEYAVDKNRPDGPKKEAFKFATYEGIDRLIRPLLQAEGMSLSFTSAPRADGGGVIVTGRLSHINGHFRETTTIVALDNSGGKNNIQAMGSALSYGKRYCVILLLNIVFEGQDDDGVRGGMVFLKPEEIDQVNALIAETRTNPEAFLVTFGVHEVHELQKPQLLPAINMLLQKKKRQASAQPATTTNAPKSDFPGDN